MSKKATRSCGMWHFVWRGPVERSNGVVLATVALACARSHFPPFVVLTAALPFIARRFFSLHPKNGDARSSSVQRTFTVLTGTKSSALAHRTSHCLYAERKTTAPTDQRRVVLQNLSTQPNGENSMLLIVASHTHVLSFRHLLVPRSRQLRLHSVLFTTRGWMWRSWHNTRELGGLSNYCVSVLIHSNTFIRRGGHLVDWLMVCSQSAARPHRGVESPRLLEVAKGGLRFCGHTTSHERLAFF